MPHKKLFLSILTLFFLQITVAQKVNAIDQKGTKVEIINNIVTTADIAPKNPNSNDVWYDTSTTPNTVKIYDGTAWLIMEHKGTEGSLFFAAKNGLPTEDNSQLFWNAANNRLGVGTNSPSDKLTVNGSVSSKGISNTGTISNSGLFTNGAGINNTGTITNTGSITNTGVITNSVGAVAAPSYNFTGAATTGLFYRPTASGSLPVGLGFSVAGTEVFNSTLNQVNFLKNVRLAGQLFDGSGTLGSAGTSGQVLTSTGSGTSWVNNANWLSTGNTGTTASNFLGNIDDIKMSIRSDNLSMLEFGRRKTLNLTESSRLDYKDDTQPVVYLRGDGKRAALQFAADGASFYKPMFFTVDNGSFRLKGSAGKTDMFEIGSAGPANDGRLEFIVGDDGKEPMLFKRYIYTANTHKEMFRVQGADNTANAKTRFGININPTPTIIDTLYDTTDSGALANSTFQVNGSISNSTFTTTEALTLTEDHYAITLGGNHSITLPTAADSKGRIYVIKNPTSSNVTISSYLNNLNVASTSISTGSSLWIQSDGTYWQQITGGNETITTISNIVPAASGNLIGNYKNEANVTTGVYETVTSLTQSIGSSATGEITYKDEKGNSSKARVVSANANNQIEVGTDGGAYLGANVYAGWFELKTTGTTSATSVTYVGLPFQPSQMTFVAHANVENIDLDLPGSGANDINNSFGTMNGVARQSSSTTISQQVIYIGGSGQSINNISRFSSSSNCIGLRYGNQDAANLGKITASMTSFNSNGFTLNVKYTAAASGNTAVLSENVIVLFTAYK